MLFHEKQWNLTVAFSSIIYIFLRIEKSLQIEATWNEIGFSSLS